MRTHVILAIFRRNFVSYFSSPIGYVFICAFVLLTAFAAFWPNEFFNRNLANLDQLNVQLPWILLVFIPAITMSVWAEERRQGTDELLLTLPATDFEVVLGKFKAAQMIYTVALLFSLLNIFVLEGLGDPDLGLLAANYVGYWLTGSAMLAIGMVASFLTSNLTVGFILAAAFNAPLVFARYADVIVPGEGAARFIRGLSFASQFDDYTRGLVSLSSIVYFGAIIVVMLYVCIVLIGRRHWVVQTAGVPMSAHYLTRVVALVAIAVGVTVFAHRFDLRIDLTSERLSSVSDETKRILGNLDAERPVFIEAYVSPDVPEQYVQTRLNLLSMLREVDQIAGDRVVVRINDTERFSRAASEAQEQFGIVPRPVPSQAGGKFTVEEVHLGLAVLSGLDKVVVPFLDRGIPAEYELVRSIAIVSQQARRTLGILTTDAKLFGGFEMETMSRRPDQPIIAELRKQYDVVQVSPLSPIGERYDVLLAVQPSSLPAEPMRFFIDAVRAGQPTVICEDPFPFLDSRTPGTIEPRRPASSNPFMQQNQPPPDPKGDIAPLWNLLGVEFGAEAVVWDGYNPYPKIQQFDPEFVFISPGSGVEQALNPDSPITRGLQQVLLVFGGAVAPVPGAPTTVVPLLRTGTDTGVVPYDDIIRRGVFGQMGLNPQRRHLQTGDQYAMAVHITGPVVESDVPNTALVNAEDGRAAEPLNVVLVADSDVLQAAFFNVRAAGERAQAPVTFDFDNVPFMLNALDVLAGDERFVPIRSRRPKHRTLTAVEERTDTARAAANSEREAFLDAFEAQRTEAETTLQAEIDALQARENVDALEMGLEVAMRTQVGQQRLETRIAELERERDRKLEKLERDLALEVRRVQNTYKLTAVSLPPIPPLVVALIVLLRRRSMERLGVPKARLRGEGGTA